MTHSTAVYRVDRYGDLIVYRRADTEGGKLTRYFVGSASGFATVANFKSRTDAIGYAKRNGGPRVPVFTEEESR